MMIFGATPALYRAMATSRRSCKIVEGSPLDCTAAPSTKIQSYVAVPACTDASTASLSRSFPTCVAYSHALGTRRTASATAMMAPTILNASLKTNLIKRTYLTTTFTRRPGMTMAFSTFLPSV